MGTFRHSDSVLGISFENDNKRTQIAKSQVKYGINPNRETIRKLNQASGVLKVHYAYYVCKSSILLARTGTRKISSVACGFSPIRIHFSAYQAE